MASTKFDVEKLTEKSDFGLWRIKMKALLVQQGLASALNGATGLPASMKDDEKSSLLEKAHSTLVLCLGDKALREVAKETTAKGVWDKLTSLYMVKSVVNRLYMKQRFYGFRMIEEKSLLEQLDDFNKILDDLENIEVEIGDEDKALILMNALPRSYDNFKDAMIFGREKTLSYSDVLSTLKTKELQKSVDSNQEPTGEGLHVKSKNSKGNFKKKKFESDEDEDEKDQRKCHHCHKPGHLKKNCRAWKREQGNQKKTVDVAEASGGDYDLAEVLSITDKGDSSSWVMDSGCSYHMCHVKSWFKTLKLEDRGSVLLGNNKECKVEGIGTIHIKMYDGTVRVLTDVRYIPELKRNLISLGVLDARGYEFKSSGGVLHVTKGSKILMRGSRKNGLYILEGSTVIGEAFNITKMCNKQDMKKAEFEVEYSQSRTKGFGQAAMVSYALLAEEVESMSEDLSTQKFLCPSLLSRDVVP